MLRCLDPVTVTRFPVHEPASAAPQRLDLVRRAISALALLAIFPAIFKGAELSIERDSSGRPRRLNIQGAPAGIRLQLVDGVNPMGVVVVDRSGSVHFAIDSLAPGPHAIRALEWGTGNRFGEPLQFRVPAQPASSFAGTGTYATGIQPAVLQSGDFDGDGFSELILGGAGRVVLMHHTAGMFVPALTLAAITEPAGIAVGDFNGDGRNDVAVATAAGRVAIFLNKGGGEFAPAGYFPVGAHPSGVVTADFNGDGIPDIATSNRDDNSISILLGHGDGTFEPVTAIPVGNSPRAIFVADFNGDGVPDLATANFGSNDVSILLGDGKGSFRPAAAFPVGRGPVRLAVADFNEDGKPDLAALNEIDGSVSLLLNDGSGSFRPGTSMPDVSSMAAGDIDGDGHADLVLQVDREIRVRPGRGDGTFAEGFSTPAVSPALLLTLGEFSRDGRLELAAVDPGGVLTVFSTAEIGPGAAVRTGSRTGGIQSAVRSSAVSVAQTTVGSSPSSVALSAVPSSASFGQPVTLTATITPPVATGKVTFYDGTTILGSASAYGGTATLVSIGAGYGSRQLTARYLGDVSYAPAVSASVREQISTTPGGAFTLTRTINLGGATLRSLAVGDFNHDGYSDIVATDFNGNFVGAPTVNVLLNNGDGTFRSPATYLDSANASQVAIADIDLDGNPDLVVTTANGVVWLKGNPDGSFQNATSIFSSTDLGMVRIADLNSDGYPDVIVAHIATPSIEVRLGNGDGTFQTAVPATSSIATTIADFAVGDFNRDGIPDLAITTNSYNSVNILAGVGDGTFLAPVVYSANAGSLAVADVNHDGYLDIITGESAPNVLLGKGDGTFQSPRYFPLDPLPGTTFHAITIIDIDGDGNADVLAGTYAHNLVIFFGNGDGTFRAPVDTYLFANDFLALGDFNRDGRIDLASTNSDGSPISIYSDVLSPLLTLTASPNPAAVGQNVILTVHSNFADATGTISFVDTSTGTALGSAPLSSGAAAFSITEPARGNHVYQAKYSGDGKYAATVAPLTGVSVQQPIGISLSASPNPALPGETVTLTATLSTNPGNAEVIFLDGGTPLNFQTVYSNTVTFTTTFGAAGPHQLSVVFPAYQGYEPASASYTETVVTSSGGQLIPEEAYLTDANPSAMVAADFTGDGLTDIVVASAPSQTLRMFTGTGLGKLQTGGYFDLGFVPGAMTAVQMELNYGPWLEVADPANNAVHVFNYAGDSFVPVQTMSVGAQPVAISAADFDGDGVPDLITANAGSNNVTILLSSKSALTLPAGRHPDALVVGDFSGDGNADFAVANRDDNTVSVFLGNRGGTFQTLTPIAAGVGPIAMVAGYLNADGKTDLAILDGGSGQITILLGNGNGTFNALTAISAPVASAIALTELTASGHLDLAVTTNSGLMVYAGNGDGTFQPPVNYAQYAGATAMVAAPFVLDGSISLAIAMPGANTVSLLLNEIPTATTLSVTPEQGVPRGVTFTINVTPAAASGWFTCYDGTTLVGSGPLLNGHASFSPTLLLPGAHSFSSRFDGVGFGRSASSVVPYTVTPVPSLGLASPVTQNLQNNPLSLVPGDFDNDGFVDFAFLRSGNGLRVLRGHGDGTFTELSINAGGGAPAIAADFNRDGFTDLAYSPINPLVAINNGTGVFSEGPLNSPAVMPSALAAADVDGDTIPDLILANPNGTVDVLVGIGDGTFQAPRIYQGGANSVALAIADLNEDGIPDIVVANNIASSSGALNVLLGTGSGNFASPSTLVVGAGPVSMAIGDFNGDHHADVALLQAGSNMITLLPGRGDGTFGPSSTIVLPASPVKILAADMNSDGNLDLIVMFTTGSPAFAILYGNGDGTFQSPITYQDARIPSDFAVGDVNSDGRMDVVVASQSANFTQYGVDVFLGAGQALSVLQGSPQSTAIGTAFSTTLQVHAAPSVQVTFSAPSSGPSGSFGPSGPSLGVTADALGNAAVTLTANNHAGAYVVTASAVNFVGASFALTNTPLGLRPRLGRRLQANHPRESILLSLIRFRLSCWMPVTIPSRTLPSPSRLRQAAPVQHSRAVFERGPA